MEYHIKSIVVTSKLHRVNATIIIIVFVLYFYVLYIIFSYCILLYCIIIKLYDKMYE